MTGTEPAVHRIDTSKPHPARVYHWYLGGKDNYPVDEQLDQLADVGTAGPCPGRRADTRQDVSGSAGP